MDITDSLSLLPAALQLSFEELSFKEKMIMRALSIEENIDFTTGYSLVMQHSWKGGLMVRLSFMKAVWMQLMISQLRLFERNPLFVFFAVSL